MKNAFTAAVLSLRAAPSRAPRSAASQALANACGVRSESGELVAEPRPERGLERPARVRARAHERHELRIGRVPAEVLNRPADF